MQESWSSHRMWYKRPRCVTSKIQTGILRNNDLHGTNEHILYLIVRTKNKWGKTNNKKTGYKRKYTTTPEEIIYNKSWINERNEYKLYLSKMNHKTPRTKVNRITVKITMSQNTFHQNRWTIVRVCPCMCVCVCVCMYVPMCVRVCIIDPR